ncbi:MAG: hypothetical protein HZA06_05280 [Nitrospirae bacterium]|nr:hypothetical protein [Nitrospirota bacterium]
MLNHGRKNIVFGFCYLVILLLLGMFLAIKLKDSAWAKEPFAFPRVVMRAAHVHGNLESVLNIFVGLIVDRISVGDGLKKTISILMIIGAIMHSGMLLLTPALPALSNLAVAGAVTLVIAIALMAYGTIAGIEPK